MSAERGSERQRQKKITALIYGLQTFFFKNALFFFLFALLNPHDKSKQYTRQYRVQGTVLVRVCVCVSVSYIQQIHGIVRFAFTYIPCALSHLFFHIVVWLCISVFFFVLCPLCKQDSSHAKAAHILLSKRQCE